MNHQPISRGITPSRWTATRHYVPSVQVSIFTRFSLTVSHGRKKSPLVHSPPSWRNPTNVVSAASYPSMSVGHGGRTSFLTSISRRLDLGCPQKLWVYSGALLSDYISVLPLAYCQDKGRRGPLEETSSFRGSKSDNHSPLARRCFQVWATSRPSWPQVEEHRGYWPGAEVDQPVPGEPWR